MIEFDFNVTFFKWSFRWRMGLDGGVVPTEPQDMHYVELDSQAEIAPRHPVGFVGTEVDFGYQDRV